MRCLYFNARSLTNKTSELQTLVTDVDLLAVTEICLKPEIANCELLPGNDFTIHRCDRTERIGGGTLLAVRNTILSVRRKDLESKAEMLVCEIHPENISFDINFNIAKKAKVKRVVYKFKKANWPGLKQQLTHAPWDECFVPDNVDKSLSNWCDLFLSAVNEYIPKHFVSNTNDHPSIDKELSLQIKKKNFQRKKLKKSQTSVDLEKYRTIRRKTKKLISKKTKDYNKKLSESLFENPKRFWSAVKSTTKSRQFVNVLRSDDAFTSDKKCMADILNKFFHSVFTPLEVESPTSLPSETFTPSTPQLYDIELADSEVAEVLRHLDPKKACGPDGIPSRLLVELVYEIAPSLTKLFNMSLSLGVVPINWKHANITAVFKKDDPSLSCNYRPISPLCVLSKVVERVAFTVTPTTT